MTRTDEFIGQLEGYLDDYEGSTPLPEPVRDAIRAELPSTRQRPAWWPTRRFPEMNNMAKLGVAAAALVAAALLGYTYLVAPNVGGPSVADPSPSPTLDPTPPPPPPEGNLDPGTYTLTLSSGTATVTVPAGWEGLEDWGVVNGEGQSFRAVGFWPAGDFAVYDMYSDPCAWLTNVVEPPIGPTVDDLATALAAQAMRGDALPTDTTVDGYQGKYLELSVPTDIDFADCDLGEFRSWEGRFHQGPGQIDRLYILDVEGQREVIILHHMPGTSDADLAEQQAVFESIDIQP
jgi:hypothetical protein